VYVNAGAWVVVAALAAALAFGTYRLVNDGRFRGTRPVKVLASADSTVRSDESPAWGAVAAAVPGATLGEKATLLQFSSAFCAPCRSTRRTLSEVAAVVPGIEHLEVDAEHHLELVRTLGILRTPTTIVLDAQGREVTRAAGAPRKEQVLGALASL
jgi:thiol-disulfide isomerase/thioredoxin